MTFVYVAMKKRREHILRFIPRLLLFAVFLLPLGLVARAQTERADELKQNISSHEEEIEKLEAEIAEYKIRLNDVGAKKKNLQNAIQMLDLARVKLIKDAELTQVKIVRANDTIAELSKNIARKETHIAKNKKVVVRIIHQVNEADSNTLLEILLGSNGLSNFFVEVDDLGRLQASLRDSIKNLERLASELSGQRSSSQEKQRELLGLKSQLADQKIITDGRRREQASLLRETKNKESNYTKLLVDKEASKKQFEREIENFEAQLRAEVDPSTFPAPGTKVLAYPLDEVFVTQKFGKTVDAIRLYAAGTHNGMDFRAAPDTPVRAAGDGTVLGQGDTDLACRGASYGRWVLIKHKNGLSTMYSHLVLIKVKEVQEVRMGDVIGYSGSTGYATGPHLHFGLFVSSVLQIVDFPSKSCAKAVFRIPVAPLRGYLDPQAYF